MRISAKGRYALAATISMAQEFANKECITVVSISEKLGISKIYLEQVFALLKRAGIVSSVKGAQGGYMLTRMPMDISVYDILSAVETSLIEETEATVADKEPGIDAAMRIRVFDALDQAVMASLSKTSLDDLVIEAQKHNEDQGLMYFI